MENLYAEFFIKIKKSSLDEKALLERCQQIIMDYQNKGIDVSNCSISKKPEKCAPDEICIVVRAGERTQSPNYKQLYSFLGEFIQFLFKEMGYVGPINIALERKFRVFEIQTDLP